MTLSPLPEVTTIPAGFSVPVGIVYDGANIWVTEFSDVSLKKLDAEGNVIQTVPMPSAPEGVVFDGTNLWVTNSVSASSVTVVRAATGAVLATLTGNGLHGPAGIAFDGERILVTNQVGHSVSLWKAADLTPLGSVSTGVDSDPRGVCSDGLNFWIALFGTDRLARF